LVFAPKYKSSIAFPEIIADETNTIWLEAEAARNAGLLSGMPIAIIGSPFEVYWARTGRHQIVGVIPPAKILAFSSLPPEKREVLYREFARAGARAVVSLTLPPPVPGDSSWVAHNYLGWVKHLTHR